jgi:hypothetical protein
MIVVLTILLGYAVLFYLLSREGIEVWENLQGLVLMSPIIVWVIQLVNWLFGTELGQDAWFFTWLGLFLAWTLVCIWFLIYEYWKRRKRARLWQKLMNSEEY